MNEKIVCKAFKTKIYPTEEQINYFKKCFGVSRFAYNWYVNKKQEYYSQRIKKSFYDLRDEFSSLREKDFPFVLEVNSRVYNFALNHAHIAYERFFKKLSNFPKFKSKKNNKQSFTINRCLFDVNNSKNSPYKKYKSIFNGYHFYISGGDKKPGTMNGFFIKTSENINFLKDKKLIQLTISYDGINYFVSFEYKEKLKEVYDKHKYNKIGIDLGLKTFATQSDGKIAKLPKQKIMRIEKKINKLNQIMSKKEYDSNNYNKVKTKLNKCYKKITNIKRDFLNKYTTWLCKNYKEIYIEDLNISGMLKNKRMAKAIMRSNFFEFKIMLNHKAEVYNNKIIMVDRYFASSKICHNCGNKKKSLKLSERTYVCDKCGYIKDRDLNAALNIRDYEKIVTC